MLNRIIHFSIKHKLMVGLMTVALIIWGVWSATKLPLDAVPDITNNQVQIITLTPTLAAQETEQLVTYPIEQSLANLPDLEEMRSISRFGLSVVTVVFAEHVDIYFARQLINERLKDAEAKIPPGIGNPELAPVSSGLGEIYQYIIHPKKGAENKYTAMDLREMQDWIVARQLYGTPGVAEVISFGGLVKQYEIAVNPYRLRSLDITIAELYTALEKNNENTGGAYIDKKPNAYFIRGIGLVHSMEDIKNIVIKKVNGIPILVRDVAEVKFGNAARYGSVTYNGEKEVVGGIVMMLKGSNSAAVVERVKSKMGNIKGALPDDVDVEVYLDRTDLVNRAVKTVETNLIEGALIVLFVLVVFMGNLRAGLIVASAIPLSMLFALGMMKVFGVSANLMSLGAIDFGLIVDGAVIIVEATLHHLSIRTPGIRLTQEQMDKEVFISTSKIRNSAAFGEIIILIVYIPILTLVGIEGKMFRPMAQTVGFAIFGALLLSLTYIPMMSALFLPKQIKTQSYSDRMMDFLHRIYQPLLKGAIRLKLIIVAATVAVFVFTIIVFSKMGGEFIPQLEEGDYAFHCILPQGTSLSQSVETSMQAIRIIKSFPDVRLVVGKTGSADIPTDPMPPEATDMIIVLKPKKEWTTTKDYNEMANMIMEKLEVIPGVFFEISQPIQMRFNELMTGVRQDVAIKIFGENIDTLAALGTRVADLIRGIDGISTPQVERTTGLPQITIQYDRARIAGYGLNIEDINHTISTAFAGEAAGVVFENERKFDLVVRLDSAYRTSIEDVGNLFIAASGGIHIPLSQVAEISFKEGPAQISREDGKRIIVVGFNITHRDVATIVEEVKEKLTQAAILPVAYYYTFGGTFENLQEATARLKIAVPGALALIFILLYFTFGSIKESLLIFTAIPMSAIGGVFALLYRDMPFSISAGVGFIALFGVAVLNGIVLISTFNQLEKEGMENILERVLAGTKIRLRPVLMTATVASLGFIPMALSTGAGAEVQKPLATVVIGGLITATFLTLFVLPLLYLLFTHKRKLKPMAILLSIIVCLFISIDLPAQEVTIRRAGVEEVLQGTKNNLQYEINNQWIQKTNARINTTMAFPKTGVFVENEDLRPSDTRGILKIGLSQTLAWPGWYTAQKNMVREQLKYYQTNTNAIEAGIKRDVRESYFNLWYLQDLQHLLSRLDTIYVNLQETTRLKVKSGESPGLDSIAAQARLLELVSSRQQIVHSIRIEQERLKLLSNSNQLVLPPDTPLEKLVVASNPGDGNPAHPLLQLQQQNIQIAKSSIAVAKQENKPDFSGRFYSQLLWAADNPFSGFSVSAAFPILGLNAHRNKVKLAEAEVDFQQAQSNFTNQGIISEREQAFQELDKNKKGLAYYELTGLNQAEEIIKAATLSYQAGEIGFSDLSQYLTQAIEIRRNYLDTLNKYNQSVIQYYYYINQ